MQKDDRGTPVTIFIPILDDKCELQSCLSDIGGLPLIRRVTLMAEKAGFTPLLVASAKEIPDIANGLSGTRARYIRLNALDQQAGQGSVLLLAPDCLPDRDFFSGLREHGVEPDQILQWQDGKAIWIGAEYIPLLSAAFQQAASFTPLCDALRTSGSAMFQVLKNKHVGLSLCGPDDRIRAEKALLSRLVKATEGWMALHINRKISLAVTGRLMHTAVTPNHMTWVSMILGLIGAAFFLSPEHSMQIWGALFFLAHSILDGCDGELARLKFMESRLGGIFDFWSDNIVHVAIFAAMGVGWAAASPDSFWPWLCAALAVSGTAISASLVYFHTMQAEKKTGPLYTSVSTSEQKSAVVRIADILSRRDFIYLVLLLALLGQTHWFLIMTAIGAPIYALLLIGIMLRE